MSEVDGKTEAATPKKRREAAEKGDFLRSRDLTSAMIILGFALWLWILGEQAVVTLQHMLRQGLTLDHAATTVLDLSGYGRIALGISGGLLVLFVVLGLAAVLPALLTGGGWSLSAISPQWSRLDPVAGAKRIFGTEAITGLGAALFKVSAGVAATAALGYALRAEIVALATLPPVSASALAIELLGKLLCTLLGVLLVAAGLDVVLQWRKRERRLRMTKQEIRDEMKSTEGAPERKRAQRERQYAIAARSARKAMTDATLVLTNPTQFAVALRYRSGIDGVPVVVASGTDEAARAIRDLAAEHNVPRLESPVLARALYFTTGVGEAIASDLFPAVATVLAFIFDLDARVQRDWRSADRHVPQALRFGADGTLDA